MSFVRLENLNDFINPSSTCIKPTQESAPGTVTKVKDVNLSDCLACSGCITSAETVLVQQQNHEELFKAINDNKINKDKKEVVVSLSTQSIASLANKNSLQIQECAERLASFFVSLGCSKVFDINLARHLALVESYREFKKRRNDKNSSPTISSICPGWVCYAEKTNGDLIVPHLSRVRSPQQIMGALLKRFYAKIQGRTESSIYHVTLMPCFDKKLEASRDDFKSHDGDSRDVDCVLTPLELEQILDDEGVSLHDFDRRKLDILVETDLPFDNPLTSHLGSVSGGYAENMLLAVISEQTNQSLSELKNSLQCSVVRNADFLEVTLASKGDDCSNSSAGKIAIVNGFRNIQTVVQRLKRQALKYDYIEIMACPSGCINGGAQCKPVYGKDQAETIELASRIYKSLPQIELMLNSAEHNEKIYSKLDLVDDKDIEATLYTDFHPVPKMQNLSVQW